MSLVNFIINNTQFSQINNVLSKTHRQYIYTMTKFDAVTLLINYMHSVTHMHAMQGIMTLLRNLFILFLQDSNIRIIIVYKFRKC